MVYKFENKKANENGCKILITAGIHGSEITGVIMAYDIIHSLENNYLFNHEFNEYSNIKSITIVPVVNTNGVRDCSLYDTTGNYSANLNRNWFSNFNLKRRLDDLIDENDIIIDIHNSDNVSNVFLVDYNQKFKYQIIDDFIDKDILYAVYDNPYTFKHYCDTIGEVYAVTFECSGNECIANYGKAMATLGRFFDLIDDGLINYKYNPDYEKKHAEINYRLAVSIINSGEGIFTSDFCKSSLGEYFNANSKIGYIYDLYNYNNDNPKEIIYGPNCGFNLIASTKVDRYYKPNCVNICCQPFSIYSAAGRDNENE